METMNGLDINITFTIKSAGTLEDTPIVNLQEEVEKSVTEKKGLEY